MQYYRLKLSELVHYPIMAESNDILISQKSFDSFDDLSIMFFHYEEKFTEITDILMIPFFMVSKEIRDLLGLYDPSIRFKGIQMISHEKENQKTPLYFIPNLSKVNCLHSSVVISPNGTVNDVILDHSKVPENPIVLLDALKEQKVIINEDLAESLLRRRLYGIGLERVEVR